MDIIVGNLTDLNFRGEVWTVGRQGGGEAGRERERGSLERPRDGSGEQEGLGKNIGPGKKLLKFC